jgi:hypothetical protein
MPRNRSPRRSSKYLLAAIALLLVWSLPAGPASAHAFTRNDANDSASKIDLRSVSVSHTSTSLVHSVRTWNSWTPASLQHDSFFLIGINKDADAAYERCAFIYYTNRLRGQLSNCGSQFIRYLTVSKVNATTAKITIPRSQVGPAYEWYGGSFWVGARPCRNVCRDFAPNTLPDILHDLTPPVVSVSTDILAVWDDSTTPDFVFPFSVSDAHTGVDWSVQSRTLGATAWTTVSTGSGEGDKDPSFTDVAPGQYEYRVVAIDSQGNVRNSSIREVHIPTDVDAGTGPGMSTGGIDTPDGSAYGGSYVALDDLTDAYEIDIDHPGGPCRAFTVIGPGTGTWTVQVSDDVGPITQMSHIQFPDLPRYPIWSETICEDVTRIFTIVTGTDGSVGFGIDAVLI